MRPTSATIDLSALRHNLHVVRRHAPRSKVFAVIKANAYGHGLLRAARALADADGYAVVELDAAVRLREAGYTQPVALLEGCFGPRELEVVARHQLTTVVHSVDQLRMLDELPHGSAIDVLLKLNTGMNRLGVQPAEFSGALAQLKAHPAVRGVTVMTHFANADDARGVAWQLATLERVAGGSELPRSLANSAAILRYPETHADWVRPGIMLYGSSPFQDRTAAELGLKPVMTLAAEVIAVRDIERGDTVGYGGYYTAEKPMRIGVVACGYADGYPRHAPSGTPVRVGDRLIRTIGRVSMDMLCVDLTGFEDARVGMPVVLWGAGNPVEDVARSAGTVGYELLCALAARVSLLEKP